MLTTILSAAHAGLETIAIEVEVNVFSKGFPGLTVIGLPNKAIEEAKERVKTAITNSGIDFPQSKIIVNLAPADIPKEGSCYDLPIAVGILHAMGVVQLPSEKAFFYGELSLDGSLRHTKGVLLLALSAKKHGVKELFVPAQSSNEGAVVSSISVFPVVSLRDLILHLNGTQKILKAKVKTEKSLENTLVPEFDFNEVIGQNHAKRALTIAAAGGHNIFMQGPPGSGKTMLARAIAGILPPLSAEESLEVTKVYSVTGNIPPGGSLIWARPFRISHHTTSRIGLIGGGSKPHPGEISLAHCGVLFLDEFPEFSRSTLEALRQPMEDGEVTVTRAAGTLQFPADFMLVAAANPCPCGYLGDPKRACTCSPRMIMKYQSKLSGPLMDRIDLHVTVPVVDTEQLMGGKLIDSESSTEVRKKVIKARDIQHKRLSSSGIYMNGSMKNKHIAAFVKLTTKATQLLKQAVNSYNLSTRTYFRLIKVSQTIADLSESTEVTDLHVAEALQYRIRVE